MVVSQLQRAAKKPARSSSALTFKKNVAVSNDNVSQMNAVAQRRNLFESKNALQLSDLSALTFQSILARKAASNDLRITVHPREVVAILVLNQIHVVAELQRLHHADATKHDLGQITLI